LQGRVTRLLSGARSAERHCRVHRVILAYTDLARPAGRKRAFSRYSTPMRSALAMRSEYVEAVTVPGGTSKSFRVMIYTVIRASGGRGSAESTGPPTGTTKSLLTRALVR